MQSELEIIKKAFKVSPNIFAKNPTLIFSMGVNAERLAGMDLEALGMGGLNREDLYRGMALAELHSTMAQCDMCPRCTTRKRVVIPDGMADADIFIIASSPSWHDDRTGITLTGNFSLKASNCLNCSSWDPCWSAALESEKLTQDPECPNVFEAVERDIARQRLVDTHKGMLSPGRVFDVALRNLGKDGYIRTSWDTYMEVREAHGLSITDFSHRGKLYLTHLVKCRGSSTDADTDFASSADVCAEWLYAERILSKAKVTVCLGQEALRKVLRDPDVSVKDYSPRNVPGWGYVYCGPDPEAISHFPKDSTHFALRIEELRSTLAHAIKKSKEKVTVEQLTLTESDDTVNQAESDALDKELSPD